MGYKKQLTQIIKKFNTLKELQKEKIKEIQQSEMYAEAGKEEFIRQAKEEAKGLQEEYKNEALGIIEAARKATLARKKSVTKDQNFNIQLSNALNILNTIGKDMPADELKILVEPFKEDYYTVNILRCTAANNYIKGLTDIFGNDGIQENIQSLEEIQRAVNTSFTNDIDKANTMPVSIALNYYSEGLGGAENE